MSDDEYLLSGAATELERLQLQSRVWEPAGRRLLARFGDGRGLRALDAGCGALGWLRLLNAWVADAGEVVGTDVDERLLAAARGFCDQERFTRVRLVRDDLFASALEPASFDLVHARFQLAPLGRFEEQLDAYLRLTRPGGLLVLEDPDGASWRFHPQAPAAERLIGLVRAAFREGGGDFDAGSREPALLRARGLAPTVQAEVVALEPGHPYLRLPLMFAASLAPRLAPMIPAAALERLTADAATELAEPGRWGTSFTLIQTWARVPSR